jgi:ABC-type branched-subunit amino acid transport system ATPase component
VDELVAALPELAREGLSMIIVEQKPKKIPLVIDHAIVLDCGAIDRATKSAELLADPEAHREKEGLVPLLRQPAAA